MFLSGFGTKQNNQYLNIMVYNRIHCVNIYNDSQFKILQNWIIVVNKVENIFLEKNINMHLEEYIILTTFINYVMHGNKI